MQSTINRTSVRFPFSLADQKTGNVEFYDFTTGQQIPGYQGYFHPNGQVITVMRTWITDHNIRKFEAVR